MADKERRREALPPAGALQGYDQAALMSLYAHGMYGLPGFPSSLPSSLPPGFPGLAPAPAPTTDTLGVAASQAASLNWWGMANQLATQDYLSRLPQYAGLASTGPKQREPGEVVVSSEGLRLPRDTEIVRTSAPSMAERRRSQDAFPRASPLPHLPAGLTIEKKKPGRKPLEANYHVPSSGNIIDRVEITKIPVTGSNGSSSAGGLDLSSRAGKDRGAEDDNAPLNLSMRSEDGEGEAKAFTTFPAASQVPSDYYASQALGSVFLAEQIRQQQLASELQSHLRGGSQGLGAMQALLGMSSKPKHNGKAEGPKGASKNLGRGNQTTKPKKNTVASLLALTRRDSEQGIASSHPELTIEPIFRPGQSPNATDGDFDQSLGGRRISAYYDSDGRLGIKNVSESPEIRNLSERGDSEDPEDQGSEVDGTDGLAKGKRHYATEDDDLQAPMEGGWRRETTIREYTKSGIRGEVVYVAPCGKRFKQYPDITRYLEKRGVTNIKRENFSFSTKLFVGDFLRPSGQMDEQSGEEKYMRYTAEEMGEEIDKVRRDNGWKPRKRNKPSHSTSSRKSNGALPSLDSLPGGLEEQYKLLQRLQAEAMEKERRKREDAEQVKLQKEAMRILKEAEKKDKLDMAKRERELKHQQFIEEKKRKQDEVNRQKQEEKLKKLQEVELKRHQAALYKEQERERKRMHAQFINCIKSKKMGDERKKNVDKLKLEREKEKERRVETRRMEVEILSELRRPVEDMSLAEEAKQLPELERIENLRLSGEAFANILMVFEFLHNFGETLGFDMESLPNMTSFQAALLNEDTESEEELLSVMSHLVVVATEDPGVPNPKTTLTVLGQTLRQADITNTNLSEILRIFISARATFEIKLFQGVSPPELKDRKDAVNGLFTNADSAYMKLLEGNKTYQLAQLMKDKPFLCLNATHKSEILAFLCNELLNNKSVVNQIEVTMENVQVMRRKKLALEMKVKKLKILHNRKFRYKADTKFLEDNNTNASGSIGVESENHSEAGDDIDDAKSVMSDRINDVHSGSETPTKGRTKKKGKKPQKGKRKAEEDDHEDEENHSDNELSDIDDEKEEDEEDAHLSAEEMQRKIERLTKLARKKSEEHTFVNNTLRGTDLGQDRYRRRYWHLAHSGGIFVEGLESAEPWKMDGRGMAAGPVKEEAAEPPYKKLKLDPEAAGLKTEVANVVTPTKAEPKDSRAATEAALRKLGSEILVTPRQEPRATEAARFTPRITPNGDRLNLFNHSQYFNMSLSPVILNGSVTITPKESGSPYYPGMGLPYGRAEEKSWFNLLVQTEMTTDQNTDDGDQESAFHPGRQGGAEDWGHASQMVLLEQKLEQVRQMHHESARVAIPPARCHGWWRVPDEPTVSAIEGSLMPKGTREQNLVINIRKGIEAILESTKKVAQEEINFLEEPDEDEDGKQAEREEVLPGVAAPDSPGHWSQEVALRTEKYLLEQVEALEDKVASASMQVPGWKIPEKPLVDSLSFRPSCLATNGAEDGRLNPVAVAQERLLELEGAIERRYLKAPLGATRDAKMRQVTDTREIAVDKDEGMDVDEEEEDEEDEVKENGVEKDVKSETATEGEMEKSDEASGEVDDKDGDKDEDKKDKKDKKTCPTGVSRGLQTWRDAVKMATNASQLAMAFYILETSIAWDKSIMKASCQFCHNGDNENALLLCDSCDKGYHTYCFKPALTIPEGDWYCWECVNKARGTHHCLVCGDQDSKPGLIHCSTCPRAYHTACIQPAMAKTPRGKWHCPACNNKAPKKKFKRPSLTWRIKADDDDVRHGTPPPTPGATDKLPSPEPPTPTAPEPAPTAAKEETASPATPESPAGKLLKKKTVRSSKAEKDLSVCHTLLSELGGNDESWPFLAPVNTKQFPTYKKICKTPMDISTIRKKLNDGIYKLREDFKDDIILMFRNCEIFNEDDSPVGKSGHSMRAFFDQRWAELTV